MTKEVRAALLTANRHYAKANKDNRHPSQYMKGVRRSAMNSGGVPDLTIPGSQGQIDYEALGALQAAEEAKAAAAPPVDPHSSFTPQRMREMAPVPNMNQQFGLPQFTPEPQRNAQTNDAVELARQITSNQNKGELTQALGQTWPAQMAKSAYEGATAPGDALAGRLNPNSDEAIKRALDLAGLTAAGSTMGRAPAGAMRSGIARQEPIAARASFDLPSEKGYIYHSTNIDRAGSIAEEGLKLHKPHEFTDQRTWPDGRTEPRSYFSENAGTTAAFAPEEGKSVVLRMKKPEHARTERGTRDVYLNQKVSPENLEILTSSGKYIPLKEFFSMPKKGTSLLSSSNKSAPLAVAATDAARARELNPIGLYSHGHEVAAALQQAKGTPEQFAAMLNKAGVKPQEFEAVGWQEAMAGKPSVTRDEVAALFRERGPQIEETVLGDAPDWGRIAFDSSNPLRDEARRRIAEMTPEQQTNYQANPTKYAQYTMPGSENYREVLLRTPNPGDALNKRRREIESLGTNATPEQRQEWASLMNRLQPDERDIDGIQRFKNFPEFKSSHWNEPNVLTHIRMADRTGPNGERLLHVEELQSDWAQKGRKEGFKKRYSKEETEKFSISKNDMDKGLWVIRDQNGEVISTPLLDSNKTPEEILKGVQNSARNGNLGSFKVPTSPYVTNTNHWTDLALKRVIKEAVDGGYDRVVFTPGAEHVKRYGLSEGEGMKSFYDKIVPGRLKELTRKLDKNAQVAPVAVQEGMPEMLSLQITPAMREAAKKGLPSFASGGAVDRNPSEAQKEAGNYKKAHRSFAGLPITIENPKGSFRSGVDKGGKPWSVKLPAHYGYIKRTEGADGDHVDVYLGPNENSGLVFVVNQKDLNSGHFDEHKCMLGFNSANDAMAAYKAGFSDGKGAQRAGSVETMTIDQFKQWLKKLDTRKPVTESIVVKALRLTANIGGDHGKR